MESNMEPKIIAETADFAVLNKPAGMLVHPTLAHESGTLVAWLKKQYPEITTVGDDTAMRPGIVHRLDKDTSGLIIVARTQRAFDHFKTAFQKRTVQKEYAALAYGTFREDHGTIDLPIARSARGTMAGARNPYDNRKQREAKTEWQVTQRFAGATLLRVQIHTGRTHQIRAHMKAIGHPIVGDPLYRARLRWKKTVPSPPRLFLHAQKIAFTDGDGKRREYFADLPPALKDYLTKLTPL